MREARYKKLQRVYVTIILLVSFIPLFVLGTIMYYQVESMYKEKIEEQIRYRVNTVTESIDLFLKERTAILGTITDTHNFDYMVNEKHLLRIFDLINFRAGSFVDIGIIDDSGKQRAYVGPFKLKGLNYYNQPWFSEVMTKGIYISDVYTGYREIPHFIIAIRKQVNRSTWILRATINPDVFDGIVRTAQLGKTGDAYIINKDGIYQTRPRFNGKILGKTELDTRLFGGRTSVIEAETENGNHRIMSGRWLDNKTWLLIVSQEVSEELEGLVATRNIEFLIMIFGVLIIIITTVLTMRRTVSRLKEADNRIDRLNAQLHQSDKLAALGKLAAGAAHEINNPLAVIQQKTGWMEDLLKEEDLKNSENYKEYLTSLKKIEEHVDRAKKVMHNMLGYARRMEPRLQDVDINETLRQTTSLLENYARNNNIEIKDSLQEDMPIIASDQSQLQQVFLNILSNAIDASNNTGIVEVESGMVESFIEIKIKDNGSGITKELQKKIFDPFFTTKESGKGTGLGLWVTYNIVENLGGSISLESARGKGTTFTVKIPYVSPEKK